MSPKRVPKPLPSAGCTGRCPHPKVPPLGCAVVVSTPLKPPPVSLGVASPPQPPTPGVTPPAPPEAGATVCPPPGHHPGGLRRPVRRQAHQGPARRRAPGRERRLHGALRRAADDHGYAPGRAVAPMAPLAPPAPKAPMAPMAPMAPLAPVAPRPAGRLARGLRLQERLSPLPALRRDR